jgi:hypothetical protein
MVSPNSRAPLSDDKLRLLVMQARESLRQRQAGIIPDPANTAPGVWNDPTPPALQPNSATLVSTGSQPMGPANRPSSSIIQTPQNAGKLIAVGSTYIDPTTPLLSKLGARAAKEGRGANRSCVARMYERGKACGLPEDFMLGSFGNHTAAALTDMIRRDFVAVGNGPKTPVVDRHGKTHMVPTLTDEDCLNLPVGATFCSTRYKKFGHDNPHPDGPAFGSDMATVTGINKSNGTMSIKNYQHWTNTIAGGQNLLYPGTGPRIGLVPKKSIVLPPSYA